MIILDDDEESNEQIETRSRMLNKLPQRMEENKMTTGDLLTNHQKLTPGSTVQDDELESDSQTWRCRAIFNGKFKIEDLPENCRRPQSSIGRTFPASKKCYETNELNELLPSSSTTHLSPKIKISKSMSNLVDFLSPA